jgi:GT2 family glycosyltransferase
VPDGLAATVVIVNWNGERLLRACLDALARQQTTIGFQAWVVDNASSDGSVALIEREYPGVRVLRNPRNLGFAGGNNVALRQVSTPYAVLLNNDATPEPDWLEQLLAPFEDPGAASLAAVTSKVVFQPRFLRLGLATTPFLPGGGDPRELGVRLHGICVDDIDVTERVLMERLTWAPEGLGPGRYRWTRGSGELLVPLPDAQAGPFDVTLRLSAETTKAVTLTWQGGSTTVPVDTTPTDATLELPAGVPTFDVVNNVGSVVTPSGYGADRGYQEIDEGQYDEQADVFALCGCAVAFRTEAGRSVDWFDDDFFLYYEDTDLSWRLRAAGWSIRCQPKAVVRHVHAASSVEWSPTFVFHTDRNRLLMLAKNASPGLALREWGRYPLTTASMAVRTVRQSLQTRRRPDLRPIALRLKVLWSCLQLLAPMVGKRRALRRAAVVPPAQLERRLEIRA